MGLYVRALAASPAQPWVRTRREGRVAAPREP
jgi:hypothetical protein